jgi:hypothetical protein
MKPASASILVDVKTLTTVLPVTIPRVLSQVRNAIMIMATSIVELTFKNPASNIMFLSDIHGNNTPLNLAKATATAAIEPHWITRKVVHPKRNPMRGW